MSKWKQIKRFILNIFTEEVIVEEEPLDEVDLKEKQPENIRMGKQYEQQSPRMKNKQLNAKVAYQYPKSNKGEFKFPLIPDTESKPEERNQREASSINDRRPGSRKSESPAYTRKRRQSSQRNHDPNRYRRSPNIMQEHKEKQALKKMEDVPAYLRRQGIERGNQQEVEGKNDPIKEEVDLTEELPKQIIYSRPDELDEVFRKKYGYDKEHESVDMPENSLEMVEDLSWPNEREVSEHLYPINDENWLNSEDQLEITQDDINQDEEKSPELMSYDANKKACHEADKQENDVPIEVNASQVKKEVYEELPHHLLDDPKENDKDDADWILDQQHTLEQTLKHFKIRGEVVHVTQGPTVTRFEIKPDLGVKVSTIRNLADDLKLNLAAKEIRIEAPIPGKNTVGIEIPNAHPEMVTLQQVIETDAFQRAESPLTIALGLTIEGDPLITNIEKMPHGLIAGATGSGKSVCINSILLSLLYKASHEDVKLLLIDPKMVELAPYNGVPHLVSPVITDVKAATAALQWAVNEMEERYDKFVTGQVRNIEKYNEKVLAGKIKGSKMPYLVIVIDELADLMMSSPQDVEDAIARIAQKARACGIHLLLATQRPSVDVITGLIKANIPTRIAFSVSSQVDSRTILDSIGAERLLGRGDMLFIENGSGSSLRLQGPFVSDEEIERVTSYVRNIAQPNYLFEQEQLLLKMDQEDQDELFEDVLLFVLEKNQASTSLLQRQFKIGYNRAARLIDSLYEQGIISAQNGSKPRDVLITYEQAEEILFNN